MDDGSFYSENPLLQPLDVPLIYCLISHRVGKCVTIFIYKVKSVWQVGHFCELVWDQYVFQYEATHSVVVLF